MTHSRRDFLRGLSAAAGTSAALAMFPPVIRNALAIPANRRTRSLQDIEHIVILMQENRSFDHYFGTLHGVRGFGDRFPIPVADTNDFTKKNVWYQPAASNAAATRVVVPFHLNTTQHFEYMRVEGTPHTWPNASLAWGDGRLNDWPRYKTDHAMGYFKQEDIPFQFALANAFTICDAYHCSFQGGTNPNRLFHWTGTNDGLGRAGGPAMYNEYDNLEHDPDGGYTWSTYCERLEEAGVSWQIYQNMLDNFTDNPVAGFRTFRDAVSGVAGSNPALRERGLSTRDLNLLREDVLEGRLPQVSWIVATAAGSEHPGPSSPAQGAEYTAAVIEALTADPEVWSKTVLIVNFDENDGFFDHVPPPAAPSYVSWDAAAAKAELAGASTVDTTGEYHEVVAQDAAMVEQALKHKPFGLGPRVPLYVVSPFSKGGWVSSEVFDHTSVIRFIEQRFGVEEPNISAWRRAVCGDLTSTLDLSQPDDSAFSAELPVVTEAAAKAALLEETTTPPTPEALELPTQAKGTRPSRALPYELHTHAELAADGGELCLSFANTGRAAAVFHVYDKKHLERAPRRYTVEPEKQLQGYWGLGADGGEYDLWVLGPNGYHRHFTGAVDAQVEAGIVPEIRVRYDSQRGDLSVLISNAGDVAASVVIRANAYSDSKLELDVEPNAEIEHSFALAESSSWYDFSVTVEELPGFSRRFAGRVETGRDSISDPALGGPALGDRA
jgi:phospholipase C